MGFKFYAKNNNQLKLIDPSDFDVTVTGAVEARSLGDRFADAVSIEDFGAVGDGVTDDTAAFRKAYDFLQERKGGTLYFRPNATYSILWDYDTYGKYGMTIEGCNGLRLIGNGCTIKIRDGAHCSWFYDDNGVATFKAEGACFYIKNCENVEVSGFTCDGNKANTIFGKYDGDAIGIWLSGSKRVFVHDCIFKKFATDGGFSGGPLCEDITFINVTFDGNRRQGFSACGHRRATFINCRFENTGDDGIGTAPQSGFDFEPEAGSYADDTQMINCVFYNNATSQMVADNEAITQVRVNGANFIKCTFDNGEQHSISIWARNRTFIFRDCKFFGCVQYMHGKAYNCDITVKEGDAGGWALSNGVDNCGAQWIGGNFYVSGGLRAFYLAGAISNDAERKVIDGVNFYIDGSTCVDRWYYCISRQCLIRNCRFFLQGTEPEHQFYAEGDHDIWSNCVTDNEKLAISHNAWYTYNASYGVGDSTLCIPGNGLGDGGGYTIQDDGSITVTSSLVRLGGNGKTLTTINGGRPYQKLLITNAPENACTVAHNTGNILLDGATDKAIKASAVLELVYDAFSKKWRQVSYSAPWAS